MANSRVLDNGNILVRAYAGVKPDGGDRWISKTLPGDSSELAVRDAKRALAEQAAVLKGDADLMTVSAVLHFYLDCCEMAEYSPTTLSSYWSYTNKHVDKMIGHVYFDKAEAKTFTNMYRILRMPKKKGGAELSIATVERIHAMLSGCFSNLKADGILDRNPLLGVKVPRAKGGAVEPLTKDDYVKFISWTDGVLSTPVTDERSYELFMFANLLRFDNHTGIRRGELSGAQERHYRVLGGEKGLLVLRTLIYDPSAPGGIREKRYPKSKKSRRFVSVGEKTDAHMENYLAVKRIVLAEHGVMVTNTTPLFCHADGSFVKPAEITSFMKWLVSELGLEKWVHPHTLRHTHASYLLAYEKASLVDVQNRLGHEDQSTTGNLYGHLVPGSDPGVARDADAITERIVGEASLKTDLYKPVCPVLSCTCSRYEECSIPVA